MKTAREFEQNDTSARFDVDCFDYIRVPRDGGYMRIVVNVEERRAAGAAEDLERLGTGRVPGEFSF